MKFKDFLPFKKGDEQSAPSPRKPANKLSKPRTNNNSNLNLLNTKSNTNLLNTKSAPASRRNSIITNIGYVPYNRDSKLPSEAGDIPEKKEAPKQKRRLSLFRSKSEKTKEIVPDLDLDVSIESVGPSPVDPPSRRWSNAPSTRGRGYSFKTEPADDTPHFDLTEDMQTLRTRLTFHQTQAAQYEQQLSRLSLVAEMPSPPLHQQESKELSKRNSKYEPSDDGTQTTRRGSDAEKYGPTRRRSLLQHGIATRPAFPETDSRRSLPSQTYRKPEVFRDPYSNSAETEYFPPVGLTMFSSSSSYSTPDGRTETPTDLDYRHIGAFKLGSLRITNGAASPTPSRDGRAASLGAEENYVKPEPAPRVAEIEQRHGLPPRSHTYAVPAEVRKVAPWVVCSESPLRQASKTEYEPLSINIPDPSFALFDFQSSEVKVKKYNHSPSKSLDLALAYQQEIASSPFSFENSPISSPTLEATSKNRAIEDDLFALEPGTPNLEVPPRLPRSFDSGYEVGPALRSRDSHEADIKPLAKADSGYSSIVSNRSFKKEGPKVPPKDLPTPIRETFVRAYSSTYSVNSSIGPESSLQSEKLVPTLPVIQAVERCSEPVEQEPLKAFKAVPYDLSTPLQSPSLIKPSVEQSTAQSHLQVPKTQSKRRSLPVIGKTAREVRANSPADSEKSVSSSGSSSIWQRKKLVKGISRPSSFQPQLEPVYTIQAFRSPSEVFRIPVPPEDIRRQLDERVQTFPVATFANTNSGMTQLRRTASKETLGTIFSVGSAEVRDEVNFARLQGALPAVPTEPTIQEDPPMSPVWNPHPNFNKRHTFQAPSPMPAPADLAPRMSFDLPPTRERSRDRTSLPVQTQAPTPVPQPRSTTTRAQTPRKSFQGPKSRDASLAQAPSSRDSAKSKRPSNSRVPSWNPRNSFQKPASRDPSPASVGTRTLDPDFENHITSFDAISSSLGKSPYELAISSMSANSTPSKSGKVITAQDQYQTSSSLSFRNVSGGSEGSRIVRTQRSYESIRNSNPWSGDNKSMGRLSPRGPPSAHTNGRRPFSYQQALSKENNAANRGYGHDQSVEVEREPTLPWMKGASKAPPVSISTQSQRNGIPMKKSLLSIPASLQVRPKPASPMPENSGEGNADAWQNTTNAWAERRKSAGQALSARKSFETSRSQPEIPFNAPPPPVPRSESRPRVLKGGKSFDTSQKTQGRAWSGNAGGRGQSYGQAGSGEEYNHAYGSTDYSVQNKENWNHQYAQAAQYTEPEYYDTTPPTDYQRAQQEYLPEVIHARKTSTSEMLGLGSFDAVMDNGYDFVNEKGRGRRGVRQGGR